MVIGQDARGIRFDSVNADSGAIYPGDAEWVRSYEIIRELEDALGLGVTTSYLTALDKKGPALFPKEWAIKP